MGCEVFFSNYFAGMRCFALLLLLAAKSTICIAQVTDTIPVMTASSGFMTPFDPQGDRETWGIKGKAIPFPVGNGYVLTTLLGVEYGFWKRHSIGMDGSWAYIADQRDGVTDTAGVYHDIGNESRSIERAIYLNYRYYVGLPNWRLQKGLALYISALVRYGRVSRRGDAAFPGRFITQEETDRSAGVVVGCYRAFSHIGRLGLDINLGAMYREQMIETVYPDHGGTKVTSEAPNGLVPRMGLNLYYWFLR
jgi:hypothetical protein